MVNLVARPEVLSDLAGVRLLDGGLEFSSRHVRGLRQVMERQRRKTLPPRHSVDFGLRRSVTGGWWREVFDRLCFRFLGYILGRSRKGRRRRTRLLVRGLRLSLRGSWRRRKSRRAAKKHHGDENQ